MDNEGKDIFSIICIIIAISMLIHFNIHNHNINNDNNKEDYKKYDNEDNVKDYINSLDKKELIELRSLAEIMKEDVNKNILEYNEDNNLKLRKSKN